MKKKRPALLLFLLAVSFYVNGQEPVRTKDSVVYRITYRDTVIYKRDTVRLRYFVYTDTIRTPPVNASGRKKRLINPNSWGIGPSVGAYYSPFNGFDVNIGFGIQYYFLSIPSFRNPHMGHRRYRK